MATSNVENRGAYLGDRMRKDLIYGAGRQIVFRAIDRSRLMGDPFNCRNKENGTLPSMQEEVGQPLTIGFTPTRKSGAGFAHFFVIWPLLRAGEPKRYVSVTC